MAKGFLTTHVLDTAHGKPASGMTIRLFDAEGRKLSEAVTNADGRVDGPILAADDFKPGCYRLEFEAGGYFRGLGVDLPDPAFVETVRLDFGLAEDDHYHVPLLVSPYAYSTYRGS